MVTPADDRNFYCSGILSGPSVLGLVEDAGYIALLAELGIAILLFLVGLKLDLALIRTLGPVALFTGLGQVIFTALFGFLLGLLLGLGPLVSIYVAIALTFQAPSSSLNCCQTNAKPTRYTVASPSVS